MDIVERLAELWVSLKVPIERVILLHPVRRGARLVAVPDTLVRVGEVRERRQEDDNLRSLTSSLRSHDERDVIRLIACADLRRVHAAAESGRHRPLEVALP